MSSRFSWRFALLAVAFASFVHAASRHYAVILGDPPVAEQFTSPEGVRSAPALTYRRNLKTRQHRLATELERRKIIVVGSADTVVNALFVTATPARVRELERLPGVKAVVEMRYAQKFTNKATALVNGPAAWDTAG